MYSLPPPHWMLPLFWSFLPSVTSRVECILGVRSVSYSGFTRLCFSDCVRAARLCGFCRRLFGRTEDGGLGLRGACSDAPVRSRTRTPTAHVL